MPHVATEPATVRPFLKWAGGKRQLLRELRRFVPAAFGAYHEPFLGSGAMFFDLWRQDRLRRVPCRLGDANPDLIGVYQTLARDVDGVIRELRGLALAHEEQGASAYYRVRDELFNPQRRRRPSSAAGYPASLAAMFIYLNRTGYNGLFRLNSRGDFNVPVGRYSAPRICDEATLRAAAAVLAAPSVRLVVESYTRIAETARPGDLVYFDPPYSPLSSTARFTAYTPASFSDDDQRVLQQLVLGLAASGCGVIVSNSTASLVTALYDTAEARAAGLRSYRIPARRAINSKATRRGAISEYIISNVPRAPSR
jgi:DNA adenine methylase